MPKELIGNFKHGQDLETTPLDNLEDKNNDATI
jgi:hypothetical protein